MNFTERKSSKIYIDIEDFAEVVGYSMSSRITTEIRKIIRKMNKELYGSEDSPDILFSYEGTSKDKKQFIIKIHKPKEIYNIKENCSSYIQIDADDIFRCQTIYDYRILYFVLCSKEDNHNGFVHKTITPDTYFLKYWVFNMTMYENCYINKKHPDYNELMLKTIEYYYDELAKYNFSIGASDFYEVCEKVERRIKEVDEKHPPKRVKKDRVLSLFRHCHLARAKRSR